MSVPVSPSSPSPVSYTTIRIDNYTYNIIDNPNQSSLSPSSPVVIIYGWVGSTPKLLSKYASMFTLLPVQRIYTTTVRNMDLLHPNAKSRLIRISHSILNYIQITHPNIPIIFGYFSNGGTFIHEQIINIYRNGKPSQYSHVNIQGTFFDSAPAYLSLPAATRAFSEGIKNKFLQIVVYYTIYLFIMPIIFLYYGINRPKEYFNNLSNDPLPCPSLYIYSIQDSITEYKPLEEMIYKRQKNTDKYPGQSIHILRLDKSKHVGHLLMYSEEYQKAIKNLVSLCLPKL